MQDMYVLITGSRDLGKHPAGSGPVFDIISQALRSVQDRAESLGIPLDRITIVHGNASGADTLVAKIAWQQFGFKDRAFPADWRGYGRAAGPIRNKQMVEFMCEQRDKGADANLVLAFPLGESRGTRGCMAMAKQAGLEVINLTEKE